MITNSPESTTLSDRRDPTSPCEKLGQPLPYPWFLHVTVDAAQSDRDFSSVGDKLTIVSHSCGCIRGKGASITHQDQRFVLGVVHGADGAGEGGQYFDDAFPTPQLNRTAVVFGEKDDDVACVSRALFS